MEEIIRIEVTKISFEDFQIIKELMEEWEWKDTITYDLIHSSEDENPIITFYIPKDYLGDFFGTMYFMGAESVYRRH
jgi:hypothetical protein